MAPRAWQAQAIENQLFFFQKSNPTSFNHQDLIQPSLPKNHGEAEPSKNLSLIYSAIDYHLHHQIIPRVYWPWQAPV
jgi:hypothetical protein